MPEFKGTPVLRSIIIAAECAVIARPTKSRHEGEVDTYVIRIVHVVDGR